MSASLLIELARRTYLHHALADRARLAILDRPSLDGYRAFLAHAYSFEAPVEAACVAAGLPHGLLRACLKTGRLAADLGALGVFAHGLAPAQRLRFASPAEAFGWLYVLHRNTLVHGLASRTLAGELPDAIARAGSYLAAVDGRAGALLRELCDAAPGGELDAIVAAARAAFGAQQRWYARRLRAPNEPPSARPVVPGKVA